MNKINLLFSLCSFFFFFLSYSTQTNRNQMNDTTSCLSPVSANQEHFTSGVMGDVNARPRRFKDRRLFFVCLFLFDSRSVLSD